MSNESVKNVYEYTARRSEADTGQLQYNRQRYYMAKYGRFMNWDPIRFDGGGNLYRYAGNNPVMMGDPRGLFPNLVPGNFFGDIPDPPRMGYRKGNGLMSESSTFTTGLEMTMPFGHDFSERHDAIRGGLEDAGVPSSVANIPTMPIAYPLGVASDLGEGIGAAGSTVTDNIPAGGQPVNGREMARRAGEPPNICF